MATEKGQRVGAILKADEDEVHLLGYGIYDGDHEPPEGPMGLNKEEFDKTVKKQKEDGLLPEDFVYTNPRITLDDGRVVWGYQCWWTSEEKVKEMIGDRKIINATIEE